MADGWKWNDPHKSCKREVRRIERRCAGFLDEFFGELDDLVTRLDHGPALGPPAYKQLTEEEGIRGIWEIRKRHYDHNLRIYVDVDETNRAVWVLLCDRNKGTRAILPKVKDALLKRRRQIPWPEADEHDEDMEADDGREVE